MVTLKKCFSCQIWTADSQEVIVLSELRIYSTINLHLKFWAKLQWLVLILEITFPFPAVLAYCTAVSNGGANHYTFNAVQLCGEVTHTYFS